MACATISASDPTGPCSYLDIVATTAIIYDATLVHVPPLKSVLRVKRSLKGDNDQLDGRSQQAAAHAQPEHCLRTCVQPAEH